MTERFVVVVCGLRTEAKVATAPGRMAVMGGGCRAGLEDGLAALDPSTCHAVVSFGLAGGLDPGLPVGAIVIPSAVSDGATTYPTSERIRACWAQISPEGAAASSTGLCLAGSNTPLLSIEDKMRLRAGTGAAAVDMESHVAAAYAARRGLPFAVLRVISDPADCTLPAVAGSAMRPDGSVDVLGVLKGLARDPGQIPALIRTARDAGVAFRALRRVRGLLDDLLRLDL